MNFNGLAAQAFHEIAKPLASLLVHFGLEYEDASEILKHSYVEAVRSDADREGKKISITKISALTGLSRQEIGRCDKRAADTKSGRCEWAPHNNFAALVTVWANNPLYSDDEGIIDIPRNGSAPSFEVLVKERFGSLNPKSIIEELIKNRVVEIRKDGLLRLLMTEYVIRGTGSQKAREVAIEAFGEMTSGLLSTLKHNLVEDGNLYQKHLFLREIPKRLEQELEAKMWRESDQLLHGLNDWAADDKERRDQEGKQRGGVNSTSITLGDSDKRWVGIGVYYYDVTDNYAEKK